MRKVPFGQAQETLVRCADGQEAPIRLVVGRADQPGGELFVASFADIRKRLEMERALRLNEQQFRALITNIPGISFRCRIEKDWPLVYISDAVEAYTGYAPPEFLGDPPAMRLTDLVLSDERELLSQAVTRALSLGKPFDIEFRLRHRDGSTRWIWATGRGVDDDDGQTHYVDGVLLDISERREMEEALRTAKQQAEDAMHARTAFLANMSHEIRTPMNAIIGFTEVVLASPLEAEARQHLQTVRTAARSLLVLLNDILDSSKLDRGALELEALPYDLRRVMQQVIDEQVLNARRKGLNLRVECAPDVPPAVLGDAHRMRQVLVNLLGNAVKFTERGHVELGARLAPQGRLHLWVRDSGIGIAADRLERIFDPFTQADATMSRRYGGTGLGTTICRQIVELMGGRIWAESTLGEGSTFHIDLPCVVASLPERQEPAPETVAALPPLRILVVDDVAENRQLLQVLLGRDGHQMVQAVNGLEAVELAGQGGFDLVLMDLQMPELDGLSACRRIRAREAELGRPRLPIIALSASVFNEDRTAASEVGMDGFALKPVDPVQLRAEMRQALAHVSGQAMPSVIESPGKTQPVAGDRSLALNAQEGRGRWGDDVAWAQALSGFCRHKRDWLRDNDPDVEPGLDEAQATGHRFRGVASNLAMPVLASAAAELERCVREGLPLAGAWQVLYRAVVVTLDAAEAELHALTQSALETPVASETRHADRKPSRSDAQWQVALQAFGEALRRGECPDADWRALEPEGPERFGAQAWAALSQAIDDFDFDAAAQALDGLCRQLGEQTSPEGHPDEHHA